MHVAFCDQRYEWETQADHKEWRKDEVWTKRRRPWQTRATVAIYSQKESSQSTMGRDEALFRIPGATANL